MAEFAEVVHCMMPKTKDMPAKMETKWDAGLWLGCDVRTGEHMIGRDNGVFRVYNVCRKPEDSRWSVDRVQSMTGTPKEPMPGSPVHRPPTLTRKHVSEPKVDEQFVQQPPAEQTTVRDWKYIVKI